MRRVSVSVIAATVALAAVFGIEAWCSASLARSTRRADRLAVAAQQQQQPQTQQLGALRAYGPLRWVRHHSTMAPGSTTISLVFAATLGLVERDLAADSAAATLSHLIVAGVLVKIASAPTVDAQSGQVRVVVQATDSLANAAQFATVGLDPSSLAEGRDDGDVDVIVFGM